MTGGHRRILVVEDDPETAGQLVESLKTSGYQVDLATSGNEALSRVAAGDYAVITIDRMLPDIDGIAVMLGALELLWYSGTVFGAVNGAQKYNRDVQRDALDALRTRYDDHPETWPPSAPRSSD